MTETYAHYDFRTITCDLCYGYAGRHSKRKKRVITVGGFVNISYGYYYCPNCNLYFRHPGLDMWTSAGGKYARSMIELARAVSAGGLKTLKQVSEELKKRSGHHVPTTTIHDWLV